MIRTVLQFPHDGLRREARPITEEEWGTEIVYEQANDLIHTMVHHKGVGLASTQCDFDEPLAMFAMLQGRDESGVPKVVVICNPEVEPAGKFVRRTEGCLSFARGLVSWSVTSPEAVRIRFRDTDGRSGDMVWQWTEAQCAWHESAHLEGRLMLDSLSSMQRAMFLKACARAR